MTEITAPDRNLAMELVRVTEAAALAASRWMGRGDKNGADGAAVDAMRLMLTSVAMRGTVIIGEGEKDEAPMLYNGEEVGDGTGVDCDIAVDPIDGTTLTALGRGNAIAVIAVSPRGTMYNPGPCVYMDKLAVGPDGVGLYMLRLTAGTDPVAVQQAVDAMFENGPQRVQTTTEAEFNRQFISMLGDVPTLLQLVGGGDGRRGGTGQLTETQG